MERNVMVESVNKEQYSTNCRIRRDSSSLRVSSIFHSVSLVGIHSIALFVRYMEEL